MKNKLPRAKAPLPKFKSDREAAEYFDEHSVAEVWDELPEVKPVKLSAALEAKIRERHERRKSAISIRLEPEQIEAAKSVDAVADVDRGGDSA